MVGARLLTLVTGVATFRAVGRAVVRFGERLGWCSSAGSSPLGGEFLLQDRDASECLDELVVGARQVCGQHCNGRCKGGHRRPVSLCGVGKVGDGGDGFVLDLRGVVCLVAGGSCCLGGFNKFGMGNGEINFKLSPCLLNCRLTFP